MITNNYTINLSSKTPNPVIPAKKFLKDYVFASRFFS